MPTGAHSQPPGGWLVSDISGPGATPGTFGAFLCFYSSNVSNLSSRTQQCSLRRPSRPTPISAVGGSEKFGVAGGTGQAQARLTPATRSPLLTSRTQPPLPPLCCVLPALYMVLPHGVRLSDDRGSQGLGHSAGALATCFLRVVKTFGHMARPAASAHELLSSEHQR